MWRFTTSGRTLIALALTMARLALAQSTDSVRATPGVLPFHLEVGAFLQSLDQGYGTWRGADTRLMWISPRATPFIFASTQSRDAGSISTTQQTYGAGSYLTFNRSLSAIVSASVAPSRAIELYPRRRVDAALMAAVPGANGLLVTAGITDLRFAGDAGGQIVSAGPIWYHGRGIYSGIVRFNRDRPSGARSQSFLAAAQYGTQGEYWIGGSIGGGNEAYQVLAVSPFDARFESRGASAFVQKWITRRQGLTIRYDFEHKLHTYHRNGGTLTYFVDF